MTCLTLFLHSGGLHNSSFSVWIKPNKREKEVYKHQFGKRGNSQPKAPSTRQSDKANLSNSVRGWCGGQIWVRTHIERQMKSIHSELIVCPNSAGNLLVPSRNNLVSFRERERESSLNELWSGTTLFGDLIVYHRLRTLQLKRFKRPEFESHDSFNFAMKNLARPTLRPASMQSRTIKSSTNKTTNRPNSDWPLVWQGAAAALFS